MVFMLGYEGLQAEMVVLGTGSTGCVHGYETTLMMIPLTAAYICMDIALILPFRNCSGVVVVHAVIQHKFTLGKLVAQF